MGAQKFSTNTGLSATPEVNQNTDPQLYGESLKLRGGIRSLQGALDAYTGVLGEDPDFWSTLSPEQWILLQNHTRVYCKATVAIGAGQIVNLYNNAGLLEARLADAATPQYARAYATAAVSAGVFGEFRLMGVVTITGLTPGAIYYLANTAGLVAAAAGTNPQMVGWALSSTKLFFNPTLA